MAKEQVKLTRICDNCLAENPSFRIKGIGSALQRICLECGKDVGFVFKGKKSAKKAKKTS